MLLTCTPLLKNESFPTFDHNFKVVYDAFPSSLMDSIVSPKVKTTKGEGVGARSLARNTLGVEGRVGASRWD
jgi:hypothetical protein